ncbi:MAG: hypothetical protein ABIH89_04960, partial [Elusimicrobiota bacterium]
MNINRKKIFEVIFPLFSVWAIYIYIIIAGLSWESASDSVIMSLLFMPVALMEIIAGNLYAGKKPFDIYIPSLKYAFSLFLRMTVWFAVFMWFVPHYPPYIYRYIWLDFYHTAVMYNTKLVYIAEAHMTLMALILWGFAYYYITVKRHIFRMTMSFVFPVLLSGLLFFHFFFFGGIDDQPAKVIAKQEGVKALLDPEEFPKNDYQHFQSWVSEQRFFPGGLYKEKGSLIALYANPYGKSHAVKKPYIVGIDLNSKHISYFPSYFVQDIAMGSDLIVAHPWYENLIVGLDKRTLSVREQVPVKMPAGSWLTGRIAYNENRNEIYLTNVIKPEIARCDFKTGQIIEKRSLDNTKYGGSVSGMEISEKTGKLYCVSLRSSADILEINTETLETERALDLGAFGISSMLIDNESSLIYAQDSESARLYEIDMKTFEKKRVLEGEYCSLSITIDRKRNALYLLSYLYGSMFAVDIKTGEKMWSVKVGAKPFGLVLRNDKAYVNSR